MENKKILMHDVFFEEIMDKPSIRLFLIDAPEPITSFIKDEHDDNVKFECNHAIDSNGTQYFIHEFSENDNENLSNIVISSVSKNDLILFKTTKESISIDSKLQVSISANVLWYDGENPDDATYQIYNDGIELNIVNYSKYSGTSTKDSFQSIPLKDTGLSLAIDDQEYSFFFHEQCVQRLIEIGDIEEFEEAELSDKLTAFVEKMELNNDNNEQDETVLSL